MRHPLLAAVLSLSLLSHPSPAHADWPLDGMQVSSTFGSGAFGSCQFATLLPGPAGSVYAAVGNSGGNGQHWLVQRVLPSGAVASDWTAAGFESGGAFAISGIGTHGMLADPAGRWWHAFNTSTPDFDHVPLDQVTPGAPITPNAALSESQIGFVADKPRDPQLAEDAAGGVYIATYSSKNSVIRLQHFLADGSLAPGWSPRGRLVPAAFASPPYCAVRADGAGGAIVLWSEFGSPPTIRARRVNADTTFASGWPGAGLVLGTSGPGTADDSSRPPFDVLLRSGADHWIAGWTLTPSAGSTHVFLQRFGRDGTLDPAWPAAGLDAVAPGAVTHVTFVPDSLGGVHVLWENGSEPLMTHVLASGQYATGHNGNGITLVDAAAVYRPQSDPTHYWGSYAVEHLAGATGTSGGLVFAWPDFRGNAPVVRVRWLLSNGQPDPAEPDSGRVVSAPSQGSPGVGNVNGILGDGAGGAFVSWWHSLSGDTFVGLETRLMHVDHDATLGVAPPARGMPAIALRAPVPNPARGQAEFGVTLADGPAARLELYDLGGRVLRSLELRGAGEQTVRFRDLDALAPGLYFARLTQGAARRSVRMVFAR